MTLGEARIYVIAPAHVRAGRLADLIETLGADIVQLRDRSLTPAALLAEARACATAARRAGCLFVVNDDPVLARDAGADGVHLGQGDGSIAAAREIMGGGIVGRTTRGGDALAAAVAEGADYASVSPVWETADAPDAAGGRPRSGRRRPRHRAAVVRPRWHRRAPRFPGRGPGSAPDRRGARRHRGRRPGRGRSRSPGGARRAPARADRCRDRLRRRCGHPGRHQGDHPGGRFPARAP